MRTEEMQCSPRCVKGGEWEAELTVYLCDSGSDLSTRFPL